MSDDNLVDNPLFNTPWWLDTISREKWKVFRYSYESYNISLPYLIVRRLGFKVAVLPPFTQNFRLFCYSDTGIIITDISICDKLVTGLIGVMKKHKNIDLSIATNELFIIPFTWNKYIIEPLFTFKFNNESDTNKIYNNFSKNMKRDIKQAEIQLKIEETTDMETLVKMVKKTFNNKGRRLPYPEELYYALDKVCAEKNSRKILIAKDVEGNIHASAYFVYDKSSFYYLFGGGDPAFRKSNASTLLLWEGVKIAKLNNLIFDFEGSMEEGIYKYFLRFRGSPNIYYRIKKLNFALMLLDNYKIGLKKIFHGLRKSIKRYLI